MAKAVLVRVQFRAQDDLRFKNENARVVKLVDTYVSEAYAARHAGSSPVPGTKE